MSDDFEVKVSITADGQVAVSELKRTEAASGALAAALRRQGESEQDVARISAAAALAARNEADARLQQTQAVLRQIQIQGEELPYLQRTESYHQRLTAARQANTAALHAASAAESRLISANAGVAASQDRVTQATTQSGQAAEHAGQGFGNLRTAMATLGAAALVRKFIDLNSQYEAARRGLEAMTGSGEAAAENMAYLDGLADRLGQSSLSLAQQYIGLTAATKGTALEGQATRDVFESVVGAMAKLGKSSADTERALLAVQQMASKGVVSAEEMRQQLGEALPGAMQALSKGTGIAVEDLNKMLESGQLLAGDMLPALTKGLNETFGLDAAQKVDTLAASVSRFENAMSRAFTAPGQNGLSEAFGTIVDAATRSMSVLTAVTVETGKAIGATAGLVASGFTTWDQYTATLTENHEAARKLALGLQDVTAATTEQSAALQAIAQQGLQSASTYAQLADAAVKAAEATKIQGEATQKAAQAELELAKLGGTKLEILRATEAAERAEAAAADANAAALRKVADNTHYRVDQIKAQIEALKASAGATEEENKQINAAVESRQKQIEELDKTLAKQDAEAKKASEIAAAQKLAAVQAEIATKTYGDQSKQVGQLAAEYDKAQRAIEKIRTAQENGKRAAQELLSVEERLKAAEVALTEAAIKGADNMAEAVTQVSALKQRRDELNKAIAEGKAAHDQENAALVEAQKAHARYADAVSDAVARQREFLDALGREGALIQQASSVRQGHLRVLQDEAKARGDIAEASRLAIALADEEANAARRMQAVKEQQAQAAADLVARLKEEAAAKNDNSAETNAAIKAASDAAAAAKLEAKASQDVARAKRDEAAATREETKAKLGEVDAMEAAAKAREAEVRASIHEGKTVAKTTNEAADAQERKNEADGTAIPLMALVRARYAELSEAAALYFDRMIQGARSEQGYWDALSDRRFEQVAELYRQTAANVEWLTQKLQSGTASAGEIAYALQLAATGAELLGDQSLGPLRSALAQAQAQVESFHASVQNTLANLQDELDRMNQNLAGVEQREYDRQKADIQERLKKAQAESDQKAIAALVESLRILDEIHRKKLAQIEAEKNAQIKADNTTAANRQERAREAEGGKFFGGAPAPETPGGGSGTVVPLRNAGALAATASRAPTAAPGRTFRVELAAGAHEVALVGSEDQADALIELLEIARRRGL